MDIFSYLLYQKYGQVTILLLNSLHVAQRNKWCQRYKMAPHFLWIKQFIHVLFQQRKDLVSFHELQHQMQKYII